MTLRFPNYRLPSISQGFLTLGFVAAIIASYHGGLYVRGAGCDAEDHSVVLTTELYQTLVTAAASGNGDDYCLMGSQDRGGTRLSHIVRVPAGESRCPAGALGRVEYRDGLTPSRELLAQVHQTFEMVGPVHLVVAPAIRRSGSRVFGVLAYTPERWTDGRGVSVEELS